MGSDENTKPSFNVWEDHIHPDDKKRVLSEVEKCVEDKKDFFVEYLGKTSGGVYEWFRSKGKLTLNSEGDPILLSGNFVNIHREVIQKSELINKGHHLEKVINRSINGLYIYDYEISGNTYINDEYTNITGYSLEELIEINNLNKFIQMK